MSAFYDTSDGEWVTPFMLGEQLFFVSDYNGAQVEDTERTLSARIAELEAFRDSVPWEELQTARQLAQWDLFPPLAAAAAWIAAARPPAAPSNQT
jgi:hypothetical protein